MQVERIMAMLYDKGDRVGYIRLDKVDSRTSLRLEVDNEMRDGGTLMFCINDGDIMTIPCRDIHDDYPLDVDRLERIEALIKVGDKTCAYGTNIGDVDLSRYDDIRGANTQISDTYSGDIVEIESVEETGDITLNSEDILSNTAYNETEEDRVEPKTSMYNAKTSFYDAISHQLEDLFSRYEHEKVLEDTIANSQFVRIYYDEDSYYVVGVMYDDTGKAEVVCYGYPGEGGTTPPEEVGTSYEWLPTDKGNAHGKGYYMMYQNAETGDVLSN